MSQPVSVLQTICASSMVPALYSLLLNHSAHSLARPWCTCIQAHACSALHSVAGHSASSTSVICELGCTVPCTDSLAVSVLLEQHTAEASAAHMVDAASLSSACPAGTSDRLSNSVCCYVAANISIPAGLITDSSVRFWTFPGRQMDRRGMIGVPGWYARLVCQAGVTGKLQS